MSEFAEQIRILTSACERFRDSKAPTGYPDSLALCIVDSVQSVMIKYPTVEKVVSNYRAYRRENGSDANTDSARDLAVTFTQLGGHEAWAQRIGNGNRTSTHKGAPLKAYAIEAEANAMIALGIITAQDLRTVAEDSDKLALAKKEWLKVPGQGEGTTWHYVQMLAGIPGIKPDRMIIRFAAKALGVPTRSVKPAFCVEVLTAVATELGMSTTALDHAIWNYQRAL